MVGGVPVSWPREKARGCRSKVKHLAQMCRPTHAACLDQPARYLCRWLRPCNKCAHQIGNFDSRLYRGPTLTSVAGCHFYLGAELTQIFAHCGRRRAGNGRQVAAQRAE
jgi:hypothetical protein